MTVEGVRAGSHSFAFTPPESAVPHFTLDAVLAGPHFAFTWISSRGSIPALTSPTWNTASVPLNTGAHAAGGPDRGAVAPAHLSPLQWQLMSSWMLAHRATRRGRRHRARS